MGTRILVVDDSAFMRQMLKNLILEAGAEVIGEASNGREAQELYPNLKPDLVFMDLVMPEVNGIEALKGIRAGDQEARVIMITSAGQDQIITEAVDAGATDFITKPFTKENIIGVILQHAKR